MKVRQLIKKLEKFPQNLEVVMDADVGWYSVEEVEEISMPSYKPKGKDRKYVSIVSSNEN